MVYETNSRFCSNSFIHQVLGTEMWREISNTHQPCVFDFPFSLHLKLSLYLCVVCVPLSTGDSRHSSVSESKANVQGKEAGPLFGRKTTISWEIIRRARGGWTMEVAIHPGFPKDNRCCIATSS